ncbi:MAG: rod shape-determining protein MreC [Massilia sp.]
MEYSPPPLFKQGAPARLKVTVFACISIALLMIDSRLHALTTVRQVAGTVLYPLQMAALMPRNALANMGNYFSSLAAMQKEVRDLKSSQVATAYAMQQAQLQMAENVQLRKLMGAREHLPVQSMMSEILYDARDSSTRKVVLDRGTRQGVELGLPVIDNAGVVGQVTRVFPFTAEVTLLTDKEQAIPVQVLRNGLRSVAYGRGDSGTLELRFVAPNADVLVGDVLITSGMDGIYPAGLAVAKVVQVENSAAGAFGRVVCQPLAGIDRNRQLLVLLSPPNPMLRPAPEAPKAAGKRHGLPKMEPVKETMPAPVPGATAPGAPTAATTGAVPRAPSGAAGPNAAAAAATGPKAAAAATPRPAAPAPAATSRAPAPTAATPAATAPAVTTPAVTAPAAAAQKTPAP